MSAADPGHLVRKRATQECRSIIAALSASDDPHADIHAARKAIRRLRALLALLQDSAIELKDEERSLQRLGDSLSDLRDAHVVVRAAVYLPGAQAAAAWPVITARLVQRRDRIDAAVVASGRAWRRPSGAAALAGHGPALPVVIPAAYRSTRRQMRRVDHPGCRCHEGTRRWHKGRRPGSAAGGDRNRVRYRPAAGR